MALAIATAEILLDEDLNDDVLAESEDEYEANSKQNAELKSKLSDESSMRTSSYTASNVANDLPKSELTIEVKKEMLANIETTI